MADTKLSFLYDNLQNDSYTFVSGADSLVLCRVCIQNAWLVMVKTASVYFMGQMRPKRPSFFRNGKH